MSSHYPRIAQSFPTFCLMSNQSSVEVPQSATPWTISVAAVGTKTTQENNALLGSY